MIANYQITGKFDANRMQIEGRGGEMGVAMFQCQFHADCEQIFQAVFSAISSLLSTTPESATLCGVAASPRSIRS